MKVKWWTKLFNEKKKKKVEQGIRILSILSFFLGKSSLRIVNFVALSKKTQKQNQKKQPLVCWFSLFFQFSISLILPLTFTSIISFLQLDMSLVCSSFCSLLRLYFLREVIGSQQNWREGTEISYTVPCPYICIVSPTINIFH